VALELDRLARIDSPLRRWNVRWKLLSAAVLVLAMLSVRQPRVSAVALAGGWLLVTLGRLPLAEVLRRVRPILWIVLAVGLILILTGGGQRRTMLGLPISPDGARRAAVIAGKALGAALVILALVGTTPSREVFGALRQLRVPAGIVQVSHLAYRYLFLLQTESRAVQTAMRARGFRPRADGRSLGVLGSGIGMLLVRSTERAERVYLAMQARAFTGDFPVPACAAAGFADIAGFLACLAAGAGLILCDRFAV
jgi:cobalt/nickel transport system permease protein